MDTQDFPDLADAAAAATPNTNNSGGSGVSKANGAMMFSGGAAARGPRAAGEGTEEVRMNAGATKPVFRGKAKLVAGGASNEEVNNSRMNYDFSKMNMSAATTKVAGAPGAEGENRPEGQRDGERRGYQGRGETQPAMFEEDDFEVVAEKKKTVPRRDFAEPTFGGGMPMFTRGGTDRK
jgi:hypothetical protein